MQTPSLIQCLHNYLPEKSIPVVLAAIRQDHIIWNSLQDPELLERICNRSKLGEVVDLNDWTPTHLSLTALNQPHQASRSIDGVDPQLLIQATNRYPSLIQAPEEMDLARAGAIALALAERYRQYGSWSFLRKEIDQNQDFPWDTPLACLYGWASDPTDMLTTIAAYQPCLLTTRLAIHALLCQPIDTPTKVQKLLSITNFPRGSFSNHTLDHLEFLQLLTDQDAMLASAYCQELITHLPPASHLLASKPFEQANIIRETTKTLFELEVARIAGDSRREQKHLDKLSAIRNLLAASLLAQVAVLQTPDTTDTLDSAHLVSTWKQAMGLVQSIQPISVMGSFKSGLAQAMVQTGKVNEAVSLMSLEDGILPNDPYQLTALIQIALGAGKDDLVKQAGVQLANIASHSTPTDGYIATPFRLCPLQTAETLIRIGLTNEAIDVLENAVRKSPNQVEWIDKLAVLQEAQQLYAQAATTLEILEAYHPEDLAIRRRLANLYVAAKKWDAALGAWTTLVTASHYQSQTDELEDLHALAHIAIKAEQPEGAIHAAKRALSLYSDDGLAYTYLGQAAILQEDMSKGLEYLTRATEISPGQPECWLALAGLYDKQGQVNRAVENLQTAIQVLPNNAQLLYALGELFRKSGNATLAITSLRQAVALEPDDGLFRFALGLALTDAGQSSEAIQELEAAVKAEPANFEFTHAYGAALLNKGEAASALRLLTRVNQARVLSSAKPYLDYAKAVIELIQQGDQSVSPGSALEAVEYALTLDPIPQEAKALYAEALYINGNHPAAFKVYQEVLDSQLTSDRKWRERLSSGMARVAYTLGHLEIAIASAQEAIAAAPQNAENYKILSDAYLSSELYDDALRSARIVLNLNIDDSSNLAWYAGQIAHLVTRQNTLTPSSYQNQARQAILEAQNALLQAVQLEPERADLLIKLSKLQQMAGEVSSALATLNLVVHNDQATVEIVIEAADQYKALGDKSGMISCLNKALEIGVKQPSNISLTVYARLAQAYVDNGDYAKASDIFEKAIALAPENGNLYYQRANLLIKLNRNNDALCCIETGISLAQPGLDFPRLYCLASWLYRQTGDLVNALEYAHKGLESAQKLKASGIKSRDSLLHIDRLYLAGLFRSMINPTRAYELIKDVPEKTILSTEVPDRETLQWITLKSELECELGYVPVEHPVDPALLESKSATPGWLAHNARMAFRQGETDLANQLFQSAIMAEQSTRLEPTGQEWTEQEATRLGTISILETALELSNWTQAYQSSVCLMEFASDEPYSYLASVRLIILRAEFQQACTQLDVSRHPATTKVSSKDDRDKLEQSIQQAFQVVQGLAKGNQRYDPSYPNTCLERWKARGLIALAHRPYPQANYIQLNAAVAYLKNSPPHCAQTPGEAAAVIRGTCLLNEPNEEQVPVSQILQFTRPHSRNPWVWFNAALALEDSHPEDAYSAVRGAGQLLIPKFSALGALICVLTARLGLQLNDLVNAQESIEAALAIWPDEPKWHAFAALIAQTAQNPGDQIKHLVRTVDLEPDSATNQLELGKAYLLGNNHSPDRLELAIQCLERATLIKPSEVSAWIWLAKAQLASRQIGAAAESIQQVLAIAPDNTDAALLRAEIALHQNAIQEAHDFAQAAVETNPEDPQTTLLLAKTLKSLQQPLEALQVLESAIPISNDPLKLQYERANLLNEIEGPEAAMKVLTALVADYPENAQILTSIARSQAELGDHQAALQTALTALKVGKASADSLTLANIHYLTGSLLRQTGQLDQAIQQLSEAVSKAPDMLDAYLELGLVRKERREYQQALSVFEQAARIAPRDPRPHYLAGLALKEGKDYIRSEIMLRQAAHLAPDDVLVRRQLAQVVALNVVHNPRA